MLTEKTVKPPRRWSNAGVVTCLLIMIGASPVVRAQESPTSSQDTQIRRKAELQNRAQGKVIAAGRNTNASKVPVERYTVEELKLDEPIEAEIDGKKTEVYQVYRITLFGGPFDLRAMPFVLKIDDKITLFGSQSPKLDKVIFILYDRSLLRQGATLAVGYGEPAFELTDKLSLGETRQ